MKHIYLCHQPARRCPETGTTGQMPDYVNYVLT